MLKNLNGTSDIITCDSDQAHYMPWAYAGGGGGVDGFERPPK